MSARVQRLATNEAFFRSLNEEIRAAAGMHGKDDGHIYEFVCECSDPGCTDRIALTTAEYERIRLDSARFVLAPGHDDAEIEAVVEPGDDHVVVEKLGVAGEIAEVLDPRAA